MYITSLMRVVCYYILCIHRRGHHSTSDDSTKYRSLTEIKSWGQNYDPINRLKFYLLSKLWWSESLETNMKDNLRVAVLQALDLAEKKPKPDLHSMYI